MEEILCQICYDRQWANKKAQHSFELEKQIWKELIAVYTALCVDDSYKTMVSVTPTLKSKKLKCPTTAPSSVLT